MIRKLLQWVVICIPFIYLLLSWAIVHFYQHHTYEYLLAWYSQNWPTAFDVNVFAERCLTTTWYRWVVDNALWLKIAVATGLLVYCLLFKIISYGVRQLFDDIVWVTGFMKKI